jgi:hypothetical protein
MPRKGKANPKPNVKLIASIEAAINGGSVSWEQIIPSHGLSLVKDAALYIAMNNDAVFGSVHDQACTIDFCIRHEGMISIDGMGRLVGDGFIFDPKRTNRCSTCRDIGHNKNYCWYR